MKKLRITFVACFAVLLIVIPELTSAQTRQSSDHALRNRISVSYGDCLLTTAAFALGDALIGGPLFANAEDVNCAGSFSLGYRRLSESGRWAFGGDLSYFGLNLKYKDSPSQKLNVFMVMAGAECYYLKSGIVRLYGSLEAGANFGSDAGGFAFQFNPIGVRVGSDRFAGFAAVGAGLKGIFNVGLSVGF